MEIPAQDSAMIHNPVLLQLNRIHLSTLTTQSLHSMSVPHLHLPNLHLYTPIMNHFRRTCKINTYAIPYAFPDLFRRNISLQIPQHIQDLHWNTATCILPQNQFITPYLMLPQQHCCTPCPMPTDRVNNSVLRLQMSHETFTRLRRRHPACLKPHTSTALTAT